MGTISTIIVYSLLWTLSAFAQSTDSILVEEYSLGSFQRATRVVARAEDLIYVLDAG